MLPDIAYELLKPAINLPGGKSSAIREPRPSPHRILTTIDELQL